MARTGTRTKKQTEAAPSARSGIMAIAVGAIIALVIVFLMLYGPLCDWYAAWRNNLRLQATYTEVLDEQTALEEDVNSLRTREGIEDEARRQGLVGEDETRVIVENLPGANDVTTADAAPEEEPEDPWYLMLFDSIFGFEG